MALGPSDFPHCAGLRHSYLATAKITCSRGERVCRGSWVCARNLEASTLDGKDPADAGRARGCDAVLSENSIERNECDLKGLQRGRLNDWSRSETSRRHDATL
jgi:hypothetical protein